MGLISRADWVGSVENDHPSPRPETEVRWRLFGLNVLFPRQLFVVLERKYKELNVL